MASGSGAPIKYLSQTEAQKIDEELMGPLGFSVDQLMELAGQACALSVARAYPLEKHPRVLVICGPGNNGGDGLVAARHLAHFGYKPAIVYPKRTAKPLYANLVVTCESLGIPVLDALPADFEAAFDPPLGTGRGGRDLRFSFMSGGVRPPFDAILAALARTKLPVASIDVPSGWDLEKGPTGPDAIRPDVLISLTAPKACSRHFAGRLHFLGGRFVPPAIAQKYQLALPPYPGLDYILQL
eukprot:tig00000073_g1751.t1